jgi:hypothetical protein
MNWSAIKDEEIAVKQGKTGKHLWIPLHHELRSILNEIPRYSTRILTNSRKLPWASGFKSAWQTAMNASAFISS